MARIRTIKPEFWEDERIAELGFCARLLFIGSWNLADDEGLLRWTPDYIGASLFMYDGMDATRVADLMAEVVATGLVHPYTGGRTNQRLAYVVNFAKHQRINRPSPPKLPAPSLQSPRCGRCTPSATTGRVTCARCRSQPPRRAPMTRSRSTTLCLDTSAAATTRRTSGLLTAGAIVPRVIQ